MASILDLSFVVGAVLYPGQWAPTPLNLNDLGGKVRGPGGHGGVVLVSQLREDEHRGILFLTVHSNTVVASTETVTPVAVHLIVGPL